MAPGGAPIEVRKILVFLECCHFSNHYSARHMRFGVPGGGDPTNQGSNQNTNPQVGRVLQVRLKDIDLKHPSGKPKIALSTKEK